MAEKHTVRIIRDDEPISTLPRSDDGGDRLSQNGTSESDGTGSSVGERDNGPSPTIGGIPLISAIDFNRTGAGADAPSGDPERRRRGRRPLTDAERAARDAERGAGAPPKAKGSLGSVEEILFSIHLGMAALASSPELEISREEAKQLNEALQGVAKHYNANVNPKTLAWFNLIATLAGIEGPRLNAIRKRSMQPRAPQPPTPPRPAPAPQPINERRPTGTAGPQPVRAPNGDISLVGMSPSMLIPDPPIPGMEY